MPESKMTKAEKLREILSFISEVSHNERNSYFNASPLINQALSQILALFKVDEKQMTEWVEEWWNKLPPIVASNLAKFLKEKLR